MILRIVIIYFLGLLGTINLLAVQADSGIPDPETFFGYKPGEDYRLIGWDDITSYFHLLNTRSDRIVVEELGETTLGNSFLLAIISSPKNLSNLEKYKEISKVLAMGR